MSKVKLYVFVILSILLLRDTYAQSFIASVNNTTVGLNEAFEVAFEFHGNDLNSIRSFKEPDFKGFKVLSGPNQSTSMQIINGAVSASITYSYYVSATSLGSYTIGSASIDFKGKKYSTEPLKINVVKGSGSQTQQQQKQGEQKVDTKNIGENVFIRAFADRQKVYKGEQVTVTYKLYTRLNISSPQISKLPQYQGFWSEELESINRIMFTTEVVDGKKFNVAVLKRAALFPTQTGQLSVTPFELTIPVSIPKPRKRGDIFDEFFNDPFFNQSQTVDYRAVSNTLKINVVPLPSENVPASFNGAVGNFNFDAKIENGKIKSNEPFTLRLSISGTGNISLLEIPELTFPAGFEKYEPKTSEQIAKSGRISGQKIIEYLIVPRVEGKKEISPVEFSYFNPSTGKYVTLLSQAFSLNVEKGEGNYDGNLAGFSKEDVKMLGEDIRYIKTSGISLQKRGEYAYEKVWFWAMTLAPLIAFVGLVGWKKREDRLSGNVQLMKYQRAEKIARNRLKTAKKSLDANNQEMFYSDISQALFGYLEDKLRISKSEFSVEKAISLLQIRNINDQLVNDVKASIEKCEFARFAPRAGESASMNEMYNEATRIIVELENQLITKRKS